MVNLTVCLKQKQRFDLSIMVKFKAALARLVEKKIKEK